MSDQVHDYSTKYGGRVLIIECYINTDEDAEVVAKRVRRACRGPKLAASVVGVKLFEGTDGQAIWREISRFAADAHANPRAKPFDDREE